MYCAKPLPTPVTNYCPNCGRPPQLVTKPAESCRIFLACFVPILVVLVIFILEYVHFGLIRNGIGVDPQGHRSDIMALVSRYSNAFTPTQVNATRYGIISPAVAQSAQGILVSLQFQVAISGGALLAIGLLFSTTNALAHTENYNKKNRSLRFQQWLQSGSTISSSITAAVSVAVALTGAVSLLSPNIVGGYLIASLQILLVCVVFGIMVQGVGADIIRKVDSSNGTIFLDRLGGAEWESLTSIQFWMMVLGVALLLFQVLGF